MTANCWTSLKPTSQSYEAAFQCCSTCEGSQKNLVHQTILYSLPLLEPKRIPAFDRRFSLKRLTLSWQSISSPFRSPSTKSQVRLHNGSKVNFIKWSTSLLYRDPAQELLAMRKRISCPKSATAKVNCQTAFSKEHSR